MSLTAARLDSLLASLAAAAEHAAVSACMPACAHALDRAEAGRHPLPLLTQPDDDDEDEALTYRPSLSIRVFVYINHTQRAHGQSVALQARQDPRCHALLPLLSTSAVVMESNTCEGLGLCPSFIVDSTDVSRPLVSMYVCVLLLLSRGAGAAAAARPGRLPRGGGGVRAGPRAAQGGARTHVCVVVCVCAYLYI